jgi:hypothetical protein
MLDRLRWRTILKFKKNATVTTLLGNKRNSAPEPLPSPPPNRIASARSIWMRKSRLAATIGLYDVGKEIREVIDEESPPIPGIEDGPPKNFDNPSLSNAPPRIIAVPPLPLPDEDPQSMIRW